MSVESPETRDENESNSIYNYDEPHHDRNLAVTCPAYSSSKQNKEFWDNAYVTKDCPTNYRMIAYKCYNDNDKYYLDGYIWDRSEMRYTKIDGVEYLKGVTCFYDSDANSPGGSLTRAEVFCAPIGEVLEGKTVTTSIDTGKLYYENTAHTYVDCGQGYQVASFTCSTSNDKFKLYESEKKGKCWGTKSYLEQDPPEWDRGYTRWTLDENRRYDRYAYCTYQNQSLMGFFTLTQSTTITVQARCEKRTCDNW